MTSQELKQIWISALNGDDEARNQTLIECDKFFLRLSISRKINDRIIEDVVQDSNLLLLSKFDEYNSDFAPSTFLYMIWFRGLRGHVRSYKRHKGYRDFHKNKAIVFPAKHDILLYDLLRNTFSGRNAYILNEYLFNNVKIVDIARELKISSQRVHEIIRKRLNKLLNERILI